MASMWGNDITRYENEGVLGRWVLSRVGVPAYDNIAASLSPRYLLPFIKIWRQAKRWLRNRMRKVAQVARDSIEYAPGGAAYLYARQRFLFYQG